MFETMPGQMSERMPDQMPAECHVRDQVECEIDCSNVCQVMSGQMSDRAECMSEKGFVNICQNTCRAGVSGRTLFFCYVATRRGHSVILYFFAGVCEDASRNGFLPMYIIFYILTFCVYV